MPGGAGLERVALPKACWRTVQAPVPVAHIPVLVVRVSEEVLLAFVLAASSLFLAYLFFSLLDDRVLGPALLRRVKVPVDVSEGQPDPAGRAGGHGRAGGGLGLGAEEVPDGARGGRGGGGHDVTTVTSYLNLKRQIFCQQ